MALGGDTRKVVRLALEVDGEQKNFLRMFAMQNNLPVSIIMRCMIYIAETDIDFQNRIIDEIYLAPEDENVEYDPEMDSEE